MFCLPNAALRALFLGLSLLGVRISVLLFLGLFCVLFFFLLRPSSTKVFLSLGSALLLLLLLLPLSLALSLSLHSLYKQVLQVDGKL